MVQPLPSSRALFEAHCDHVYRVLRYLGASSSDLEDLVQEVFVVVIRSRERFRGEAGARTWLVGIARNVLRDHRKRAHRRRERPSERLDATHAATEDPERAAQFRQTLAQLDQILEGLKPDQRLVFLLHDVEQMTMKEVTEGLGCPLQTGYTRLRAARTHVRERASALELEPR